MFHIVKGNKYNVQRSIDMEDVWCSLSAYCEQVMLTQWPHVFDPLSCLCLPQSNVCSKLINKGWGTDICKVQKVLCYRDMLQL